MALIEANAGEGPGARNREPITGEIASVGLPNDRSGRSGKPVVHIIETGGEIEFVISGLDPTDFEAVVGPKVAKEYRDFVHARRSKTVTTSRRAGRIRSLLNFVFHG